MIATLGALLAIFSQLSLLAFGGGNTVLPEMQRQVVDVHHWLTASHFTALFALAQAAPGPNLMVCALIGWQVAGLPGALISMIGITAPASLLTMATYSAWERFRAARWRRVVQAGLVPVTVGLIGATGVLIAMVADSGIIFAVITLAVATTTYLTRIHPLWLLAAGSVIGMLVAG